DQGLEDRQSRGGVDEDVCGSEPVGHPFREALDPDALAGEPLLQPSTQILVPAAEADHEIDLREPESDLYRARDVPDSPASAGDEHDVRPGGQPELFPRLAWLARLEKGGVSEPVHTVRLSRSAGDAKDFFDRF